MKITVLCENTAARADMTPEHGLSLYVQTDRHKLLFDMGQTDAFWHNAERLGIDLKDVDIAVLSHGHYDHGGGLAYFLEHNQKAKVYINEHAFGAYYNASENYIGLDSDLKNNDRVVLAGDRVVIDEELSLYSCNDRLRSHETAHYGLSVMEKDTLLPDSFLHEQYLLVQDGDKQVLFSGCAHKGVLNIARWFAPDVFVGGFHFMKLDPDTEDRKVLQQAAQELMTHPTVYYTGHCTGITQYNFLKEVMGVQLHAISTGDTLHL